MEWNPKNSVIAPINLAKPEIKNLYKKGIVIKECNGNTKFSTMVEAPAYVTATCTCKKKLCAYPKYQKINKPKKQKIWIALDLVLF